MSARTDKWISGLAVPGRPDEFEVKALLAEAGVPVPRGVRIRAGEAIPALPFQAPFVAKVCSAEVLHKTDRGGVMLGLDAKSLPIAVEELRRLFPGASVLVEEQLRIRGGELIVGALLDPSLGPAVMLGAGGIFTELYRDVTFRLAPFDEAEAMRMIGELKIAPLFEGFRGFRLPADALSKSLADVAALVMELGASFEQLDINPLVFAEDRFVALDAKLVLLPRA